MAWIALVEADSTQKGYPNQCLGQAQRVFGAPGTHYCALDAWNDATYKHESRDLPNVPVPVWFSNTLTIGNETRNFGHVAVWFPNRGQFLNVPASGNGQKWLNSIDEVNSWNNCQGYLGWSEDINGLQVVKKVDSPEHLDIGKQEMYIVGNAETGAHYLVKENSFIWIENNDDLDLLKRVLKSDPSKPDTFLGVQLDVIKKYLKK